MAKKITQEQIIQSNIWESTIKSTKELIGQIEILENELKKVAEVSTKLVKESNKPTFESLNETIKSTEKLNKAFEQSIELDKEKKVLENSLLAISKKTNDEANKKLKLEERLKNVSSEQGKELAELSLKIQEQNKLNKELAKEKLGLINAYEKESKRLNTLRKEFKNLVLEQGKGSKEAKRLAKEIKKLDKELKEVDASAGQFQRNVGNYPDSLGDATKSILGLAGAIGVAGGAMEAVKGGLASTEEGGGAVAELGATISGIWGVVSNTVANAALDLVDYTKQVKGALNSGKDLIDAFTQSADGQGRLANTTLDELQKKTELQIALKTSLTRSERRFAFTLRESNEAIEQLNGQIDVQQSIAGDSTRSFDELSNAVLKGQELQIERGNLVVEIARKELELAKKRVFIEESRVGEGNASADFYNQETEAINALQSAQNDLQKELLQNEIELRQIKQDRLERDLDILLDGYDNQKTINERIIANDKETIKTRQDLLDETVEKGNKSFAGQVEVLQRLTKNKVDYNELLTIDATELNQRIRSLGASEIIEGRILEVIRDRKTELNDLKEAQEDLNDATNENLDLNTDITAQYDKLLGKIKDIDARRLENEKESLKRQIKQLNEGSNEQLALIKQYNDILLSQQEEYENKQREGYDDLNKSKNEQREKEKQEDIKYQEWLDSQAEKKRLKEIENREKTLATLEALNNKYFTDKNAQADKDLEDARERENSLQELANKGNLEAVKSLAENQKQQAEANAKKEELLRKEKQFETALALIQAYNTALDNGNTNSQALAEAVTSVSVLTSLASSLPSFYDGTENTGTVANPLDSNGGRVAILHNNERVLTEKQNNKIGSLKNDEVADIVQSYNKGLLTDVTSINTPHLEVKNTRFESNEAILEKFNSLEKSIVSAIENKETYLGSDVDSVKEIMRQYYKKNGTKTVVNSKSKIW